MCKAKKKEKEKERIGRYEIWFLCHQHTLTNHNLPCGELWHKIVQKCVSPAFLLCMLAQNLIPLVRSTSLSLQEPFWMSLESHVNERWCWSEVSFWSIEKTSPRTVCLLVSHLFVVAYMWYIVSIYFPIIMLYQNLCVNLKVKFYQLLLHPSE